MEKFGVTQLLRTAHQELGGVFRIEVPFKPCTFLIGQEAVKVFMDGAHTKLSPREAYKFMIPVFGPGVVYDSPHEKMASQLSFVKHGLSKDMMQGHPVRLQREIVHFLQSHPETYDSLQGCVKEQGEIELYSATSKLIINTASRCLLGDEVRDKVLCILLPYFSR